MRKIFLFTAVVISLSVTSVAQNEGKKKDLLKKTESSVRKSGKVPECPGSSNFTKFLEKKAKAAQKNAEKKSKENKQKESGNKDSASKETTSKTSASKNESKNSQ